MNKPVRFSHEAREEALRAAAWYGSQRPELRSEFLADLDVAIEHVARYAPHLGTPPGVDPALGLRRVFFTRFPYSLIFVELPTRYRVLAVAHLRRDPSYWRDRS